MKTKIVKDIWFWLMTAGSENQHQRYEQLNLKDIITRMHHMCINSKITISCKNWQMTKKSSEHQYIQL